MNICEIHELNVKDHGLPLITFLQEHGAIPLSYDCPNCHSSMELIVKGKQIFWNCKNFIKLAKKKRRRCGFYKSFFDMSKLPVVEICKFANLWVGNASLKLIGEQCKVVSDQSKTDWASFCREVLFDKMVSKLKKQERKKCRLIN